MIDLSEFPAVTEPSEEFLNQRQLLDYRSEREECLQWLLAYGKNPEKAEVRYRWSMRYLTGISDVRQENCNAVLTDTAVIIRTGTVSVGNPSVIKLDRHCVWFVLAAFDIRPECLTAANNIQSDSLLVIRLTAVVRLRFR